jgi:hypothetical protein
MCAYIYICLHVCMYMYVYTYACLYLCIDQNIPHYDLNIQYLIINEKRHELHSKRKKSINEKRCEYRNKINNSNEQNI